MSKSKPTRFSARYKHTDYGINNWFNKSGIKDQQLKERLCVAFLKDHGFDFKGSRQKQRSFISNRFGQFVKYVQANRRFFENKIRKSIATEALKTNIHG